MIRFEVQSSDKHIDDKKSLFNKWLFAGGGSVERTDVAKRDVVMARERRARGRGPRAPQFPQQPLPALQPH